MTHGQNFPFLKKNFAVSSEVFFQTILFLNPVLEYMTTGMQIDKKLRVIYFI